MMDLPDYLLSDIKEGNAVLMLGAGASMEAVAKDGSRAPSGKQLAERISNKFLGGKYRDYPLSQICEYAISESDLFAFQDYIRSIFEPLIPSQSHRLLSEFSWRGLVTTNFDVLVENAYVQNDSAKQLIVPFIDNSDRIDEKLRNGRSLQYLKLHGCITRINNPKCPLILTPDQYNEYNTGRNRVFNTFIEWASERPIIFVGYNLQDLNLRSIITSVSKQQGDFRPRYYLVLPEIDDIQRRAWEKKNITLICGSFEDFANSLNSQISSPFRGLLKAPQPDEHPLLLRVINSKIELSEYTKQFLDHDVEYVKSVRVKDHVDPRDFYKGHNPGWSAIEQNLDIRRGLVDSILTNHILGFDGPKDNIDFILIKAHAGAGKSCLLRRIAWDAAFEYNCLCLYLNQHGIVNSVALQQIIQACQERVFLFIEEIQNRVHELESLIKSMGPSCKYLTIIATARTNEWNIYGDKVSVYVTDEYELKYLSYKDISNLLCLLGRHNALGTLSRYNEEERHRALIERAGRQLLVALHEATYGKPFIEIIKDEYNRIKPDEAKHIYLSVCVLNRFCVPVRAGLISRIHGISFEEFRKRFFLPLDRIIETRHDPIIRDYVYEARHSHIAEIVFNDVLHRPEEKFNEYMKCMHYLNLSYHTDRLAFYKMIRARVLLDLFPDHTMISKIYSIANERMGDDPYLSHQRGIYEMNRPNGNFGLASHHLEEALKSSPSEPSFLHSVAELNLKQAENACTLLEVENRLKQAESTCLSLKGASVDSYPITTLIKIKLLKLRSVLKEENALLSHIESIVKEIEKEIDEGLQRYPGDEHILVLDAQFASLLSDDSRVLSSLGKSFEANPRNSYIAIRYATCLKEVDVNQSRQVLEKALDANGNDIKLHYAYSKLLLELSVNDNDLLEFHLRRSYVPGDRNYEAQLLHARQLFINGNYDQWKSLFSVLRHAKISPAYKSDFKYPLTDTFEGRVVKVEATHGFIQRKAHGDHIYVHPDHVQKSDWSLLAFGTQVVFNIAFSMKGPGAINVKIVG